jgi:serine/threonine protein kinase
MRPGSVILTQEGMVFGTPEFMSPEQAQGKTLTPGSDIYSLAVILYEVLTGKLPFEAKSAMDYIQLHVMQKPTPLSQRVPGKTFPPLLDAIIARALSKKSEERFASAADFAQAMQYVLQGATQLPPHLAAPASILEPTLDMPTAPGGRALSAQQVQAAIAARTAQPKAQQVPQAPPSAGKLPAPVSTPMRHGPQAAYAGPVSSALPSARRRRAGIPLLLGVAAAFLCLGVLLAFVIMKL